MKVVFSTALTVLMMASKVYSFTAPSSSCNSKSFLQMSMNTYDEQMKAYYRDSTTSEYTNGDVNPYTLADMNEEEQSMERDFVSVPSLLEQQPSQAVVIQKDEKLNDTNPLILAGVAFLGLPLWLLLGVFTGNANFATPSSPGLMNLPSTVVTNTNSAAQPAGVVVLSQPITKAEVRALFDLWNDALQTLDPETVAKRYAKDGVLLPTLSDVPRNDFEGIKDYFVGFLKKKPVGKVLEGEIFVGNNWAQDAGIYEFTFDDGSKVKARYSFVYAFEDGKWMISHHHSSLMPQEVVRPTPITQTQVRGFFDKWNNALATGDPQQVAALYGEDAVLLPTLSDSARYTNDRIADYFVGFLKKKPVGEILEGNVKLGPNWAQDAGIYEFTFEDGSKTRGRYSFVYSFEKGEWKISNHHSSIMPEPAVSAMKKVGAMQKPQLAAADTLTVAEMESTSISMQEPGVADMETVPESMPQSEVVAME